MTIIRIPEPTTNINIATTTSKGAEVTDLETHVIVCSLRYEALESKLTRLENKVNEIILQASNNNRMIIRTIATIGTGIITSFLITHFKII